MEERRGKWKKRKEKISRKFLAFHFSYLWVVEILERFFLLFTLSTDTRRFRCWCCSLFVADVDDDDETQAAQVYLRLVSFSINHPNGIFCLSLRFCSFSELFSRHFHPLYCSLWIIWTHFSHIIATFSGEWAEKTRGILKVNLNKNSFIHIQMFMEDRENIPRL